MISDVEIVSWTAEPLTRDQLYLSSIDNRLWFITWLLVVIAASVIGFGFGILSLV